MSFILYYHRISSEQIKLARIGQLKHSNNTTFSVSEILYCLCVVLLLFGFSCMYIQNTKPYTLEFTVTVHFAGVHDHHLVGFAPKLTRSIYLG